MLNQERTMCDFQGIRLTGFQNRWSAIEFCEVGDGNVYAMLQNDTWGDDASRIVCQIADNTLIFICKTRQDIRTALDEVGVLFS